MRRDEQPDLFGDPKVRIGILILAVGWLAIELRRGSGWGIALAGVMCAFAGYEVFFARKEGE